MARSIAAFTLRPETFQLIINLTEKARAQGEVAKRLGLESSETIPIDKLTLDADGLSAENYATLAQLLGCGQGLTASTIADRLNLLLTQPNGHARAVEALQYMKVARRTNARHNRLLDRASVVRKSNVNNSRVAEALILIGVESLGNACDSERSSKSGLGKSSDAGKAARKSVNRSSRQTDVLRTGKRAASAAA